MKTLLVAALCLWALQTPSFAASCWEPTIPSCASDYGAFDDEDDFEDCKRQMEQMQSELDDYLSCLKKKAQYAIDDYDSAVRQFNDRADG